MVRIETLEGRNHFVMSMVMLTVGVHRGSRGSVFYPADELRQSVLRWNGRPVVVYHPKLMTEGSAGNPEVFNQQKVGTVFNSHFDGIRLLADAWIDTRRVEEVDDRVFKTIKRNEQMEVSTGLYLGFEEQEGVWNGESYTAIARNHIPDHLAILPDQIGACSLADGCGLIRNSVDELQPLGLTTTV